MVKEDLLKLCTFNCRGLGEGTQCVQNVFKWLTRFHPGIIFLQETHSIKLSEKYWMREWKGHVEFCHGK